MMHFSLSGESNLASRLALRILLALFFFLVLVPCITPARAQISPGPLARAHQSLDGVLNCTKCHDLGARGVQLKCLDCHTEIRDRVVQHRGMHAVWVGTTVSSKDCAQCHSDHNGVNFPLVHWQPNREAMDHRQTGFPLTGKHAGLRCEECHNAKEILPTARAGILVKDLNHTYLGLASACISCHQDVHRGQLGTDCERCHTADGWKPAPGFNHAITKYPLTGAHATVACAKCHPSVTDIKAPVANVKPSVADVKPFVKYKGLSFATCTGCHADPHKGAFKGTCESCHNTSNWRQVAQLEGFDHSKTKYPLIGKHSSVSCSDCHNKGDFKTPVAFAKCTDCHSDYHEGQFQADAGGAECAACHTVFGFKPSTFGLKEHAATSYPLEGRHAEVKCDDCHTPKAKNTLFKITQTQCISCHEDVHKGQFAEAPYENRCEECHNVAEFRPAHFALARHRETRFPLTGAHFAVPCAQCHQEQPRRSVIPVQYRFEDRSCTACHMDPHSGQFRQQMAAKRSDGTAAGCEACHNTAQWNELRGFDHAKTRFPLLGAHRVVACIDCHKPPALERTLEHVNYRAVSMQCSGCHNDPHGGQFAARKDVTECSSCHNDNRWKPADFDHDTRTTFSLQGAHENTPCAGCHMLTRVVEGKNVLFYKPTPAKCSDCHGDSQPVRK
jgi:hypothetical protein